MKNLNQKTTEQFRWEVEALTHGDYLVLTEYTGVAQPVLMYHRECQTQWWIRPNNFLTGGRCPHCRTASKQNQHAIQFSTRVRELTQGDYQVIGQYHSRESKVTLRHQKCGYEWDVLPGNFFKGSRCPKCAHRKSPEHFQQEVLSLVGDEYVLLTAYTGVNTHINMQHRVCGHQWLVTPKRFLGGQRCPSCARQHREKSSCTS